MKSTKSIFVVALAALILVAFTACQQAPALSTAVRTAEIVQNGVFFEGQPFDASKFTVNVTYTDGTPGTIGAGNVTYKPDSENKTGKIANGDQVSITLPVAYPNYGGSASTVTPGETEFTASIIVYEFAKVTVTGTDKLVFDGTNFASKELNPTVVATYVDKEGQIQEVTLVKDIDYEIADFNADSVVDKPSADKEGSTNVTIDLNYGGYDDTVTYKVATVAAETVEPTYTYKWDGESLAFSIAPETTSNAYVKRAAFNNSMVTIYKAVQAYDEDDSPVSGEYRFEAIPAGELGLKLATASALADDASRFGEVASAAVEFEYSFVKEADEATGKISVLNYENIIGSVVTDAKGKQTLDDTDKYTSANTVTIALRNDYPTSFKATWKGAGAVADANYDVNGSSASVAMTDFGFEIIWKSTYKPETVSTSDIKMQLKGSAGDPSTSVTLTTSDVGSKTIVFTYTIPDDEAPNGYSDSELSTECGITVVDSSAT